MTDREFLDAFENCSLPRAEWTHAAHLRMAFLYLRRETCFDTALTQIRARIQAYNLSQGNPRGYHETITVAFARLVADALYPLPAADFAALRAARPDLFVSDVLLRFYSRERLYAPEARAVFLEPDIHPLPL